MNDPYIDACAATETARPDHMTAAQYDALKGLCKRYGATFDPASFRPTFDLPTGYVCGWAGSIVVGCSPEGRISS